MKTLLIIFMIFTIIIVLFGVIVVVYEIVKESNVTSKEIAATNMAKNQVDLENNEQNSQPISSLDGNFEVKIDKTDELSSENAISFSVGERETLEQKYLNLSQEFKSHYDQIVKYANSKIGSKRYKNSNYEEYKIGKTRLVRLLIKKGIVISQFVLLNEEFNDIIDTSKIAVKKSPTTLKVVDNDSLNVAKHTIDLAEKIAIEEKERRELLKKERRKKAKLTNNQGDFNP